MSATKTTLSAKIHIALEQRAGLSDRELANAIYGRGKPQQPVNITCRQMEQKGVIKRQKRDDGIIGNYPAGAEPPEPAQRQTPSSSTAEVHTEDFVKQRIAAWLTRAGWQPEVKWGRERGIDIYARRGTGRWVIEVKGIGAYQQMRVNYFLGALAEALQRMNDPEARYSVAFPDIPQYRGLWNRLPHLAKQRTSISALFVSEDGTIEHVDDN